MFNQPADIELVSIHPEWWECGAHTAAPSHDLIPEAIISAWT